MKSNDFQKFLRGIEAKFNYLAVQTNKIDKKREKKCFTGKTIFFGKKNDNSIRINKYPRYIYIYILPIYIAGWPAGSAGWVAG